MVLWSLKWADTLELSVSFVSSSDQRRSFLLGALYFDTQSPASKNFLCRLLSIALFFFVVHTKYLNNWIENEVKSNMRSYSFSQKRNFRNTVILLDFLN